MLSLGEAAMTKSKEIRALALTGLSTAEIARQLDVRYQHAYQVLRQLGLLSAGGNPVPASKALLLKPALGEKELLGAGFERIASWRSSPKYGIEPSSKLPDRDGVYAFSTGGVVNYVGVATIGLSKRIYFYSKPGPTQRTSIRLHGIISACIARGELVDILVACPVDMQWNGLPIHACAGLELGLIKKFSLPWNRRSAG
jgi:hypothetical protein